MVIGIASHALTCSCAEHHSEELFDKYAGDKNIIIVEGDHNSPRPKFMFDSASIFLQTCLQIPNEWSLDVPMSMNLMCPPWYFELYKQRQQNAANRHRSSGTRRKPDAEPSRKTSSTAATPATHPSSVAVPAGNGYDHEEMGMTSERQRVIQASLFKMLGQADDETEEGGEMTKQENVSPPNEVMEVGVPMTTRRDQGQGEDKTEGDKTPKDDKAAHPDEVVEVGVPATTRQGRQTSNLHIVNTTMMLCIASLLC